MRVTQGELARINKQHNRVGAASYEAPHVAIARIAAQTSSSAKRLDSWVTHPDERVVIALLDHPLHKACISLEQVTRLARRAIDGARSKQVLWTPLLDALSHNLQFGAPLKSQLFELLTLVLERQEVNRPGIAGGSHT